MDINKALVYFGALQDDGFSGKQSFLTDEELDADLRHIYLFRLSISYLWVDLIMYCLFLFFIYCVYFMILIVFVVKHFVALYL